MFVLYFKKKQPGLVHWETRAGPRHFSQVEVLQVLLRRHLPALLEADINRSKFTRREKSQANIGK